MWRLPDSPQMPADEGYLALVGTFDPASYSDQTDAFRSMARSLELTDR